MTENDGEHCKLCILAQEHVGNITKLYDDEDVVVIWYPTIVPGHIALIPKQHHSILMKAPDAVINKIFKLAHQFAKELLQQTRYEGFTLISNNGIDQAHSHFSLHIIPRKNGDDLNFSWQGQQVEEGALQMVEQELRKNAAAEMKEDVVAEKLSSYLERLP